MHCTLNSSVFSFVFFLNVQNLTRISFYCQTYENEGRYYDCDLLPFMEVGSVAHKYYLLNIRIPVNERKKVNIGIGEIKDIRLVVSLQTIQNVCCDWLNTIIGGLFTRSNASSFVWALFAWEDFGPVSACYNWHALLDRAMVIQMSVDWTYLDCILLIFPSVWLTPLIWLSANNHTHQLSALNVVLVMSL